MSQFRPFKFIVSLLANSSKRVAYKSQFVKIGMKQIFKKLLAWWRKPRTKRLDPRDHLHLPFHPHCKCDLGVYETDTVELGYEGGTVAPRPLTDIRFPEPAIPVEYVEPITLSGKRIGGFFRIADGVRPILTGDIDGFGETVREAARELVGEDVKFSVRSEDPEPSDEIEVIDVQYKSCDVKVAQDGKAIDSVRLTGVMHKGALNQDIFHPNTIRRFEIEEERDE